VLAAAAIAAFRGRPIQQAASQTSPQPMAQVTLEKNEASSDSADRRSTISDHASSPTQSVSENTRHKLPPATVNPPSFPSNNDSTKPHKAEPGISAEASGERSTPLERSFREIPVVIRVEDGHVAGLCGYIARSGRPFDSDNDRYLPKRTFERGATLSTGFSRYTWLSFVRLCRVIVRGKRRWIHSGWRQFMSRILGD